jgi:hypothetical protein
LLSPSFSRYVIRIDPSLSVILETDSAAIASRVSRPKADTTDIVLNEETIMFAYNTVKNKVQQRMAQGF